MSSHDLYRAVASPPPSGGLRLMGGLFASAAVKKSELASSPNKSISPPVMNQSSISSPTLERYLSRFVQPLHALLVHATPDQLFKIVGTALRNVDGVQILKENDFKRKYTCCCRGTKRFKVKLTTVSDSKTVVLELLVLTQEDNDVSQQQPLNEWGTILENIVNHRHLKYHVEAKPASSSTKPIAIPAAMARAPLFSVTSF